LIRIPSISSIKSHKPDMYKAAEYWKELLLKSGADKADIYETVGNPVTYGEKIIDPELPTVLIYSHMDVMPVDPIEKWDSNPFEPEIRDGKIWARGADDDKGQLFMHLKAFEMMNATGTLPCNVKFMIEGRRKQALKASPDFVQNTKRCFVQTSFSSLTQPSSQQIFPQSRRD